MSHIRDMSFFSNSLNGLIAQYQQHHGEPISDRELCRRFGIHPSNLSRWRNGQSANEGGDFLIQLLQELPLESIQEALRGKTPAGAGKANGSTIRLGTHDLSLQELHTGLLVLGGVGSAKTVAAFKQLLKGILAHRENRNPDTKVGGIIFDSRKDYTEMVVEAFLQSGRPWEDLLIQEDCAANMLEPIEDVVQKGKILLFQGEDPKTAQILKTQFQEAVRRNQTERTKFLLEDDQGIIQPEDTQWLMTTRSNKVIHLLGIQSISSLKAQMGKDYKTVIQNIGEFLIFRNLDIDTIQWCKQLTGKDCSKFITEDLRYSEGILYCYQNTKEKVEKFPLDLTNPTLSREIAQKTSYLLSSRIRVQRSSKEPELTREEETIIEILQQIWRELLQEFAIDQAEAPKKTYRILGGIEHQSTPTPAATLAWVSHNHRPETWALIKKRIRQNNELPKDLKETLVHLKNQELQECFLRLL